MCPSRVCPDQEEEAADQAEVLELLEIVTCLPQDTETVVAINRRFEVASSAKTDEDQWARMLTMAGCIVLDQFGIVEKLKDKAAMFAVQGSRRFGPFWEGALQSFEGCFVMVFDAANGPEVKEIIEVIREDSQEKELLKLGERDVLATALPSGQRFYLAWIEPSVLVAATDWSYLASFLSNYDGKYSPAKTSAALQVFQAPDTRASLWGWRRFDYSYERPSRIASLLDADRRGIGFTFSIKEKEAEIMYYTFQSESLGTTYRVFNLQEFDQAIVLRKGARKRGKPNAVQIIFEDTEGVTKYDLLFMLLPALGHSFFF